ncbi:MAG: TIGR03545 family protein [Candidatus Omnitrophica bacterium]|nr:TIGR03545 family protein [Candidatus Omnitrophota bacterium]
MKIIRWSFVIPLLVICVGTVAVLLVFRDPLIKKALIVNGENAFGAKVEIDELKTTLAGNLTITGLRIADRNDVWKNMADIKKLSATVNTAALLTQKIIVEEANLENLTWGTKRTTSGALPAGRQKKPALSADNLLAAFKKRFAQDQQQAGSFDVLANLQKNIEEYKNSLLAGADLQSLRAVDTVRGELTGKYEEYGKKIQQFDVNKYTRDIQAAIEDLKNTKVGSLQDIQAAQGKLAKVNETKKVLETAINDLKSMQQDVTSAFSENAGATQKITDAINADVNLVSTKLQEAKPDKRDIAPMLFGPEWGDRVLTAVDTIMFIRKHLPPPRAKQKITPAERGVDVSFTPDAAEAAKTNTPVWPQLLVKKISFSASTGGAGKEATAPLTITGTALDVCSEQNAINKPLTLTATAQRDNQTYDLTGNFDHRQSVPVDTITVKSANLDIAAISGGSGAMPKLAAGTVNIDALFSLNGDILDSKLNLAVNNAAFSADAATESQKILTGLLQGISSFTVTATAAGAPDNLQTTISSDLDGAVGDKINALAEEKIGQLKTQLQDSIRSQAEQKTKELFQQVSGNKGGLEQMITEKLSALTKGNEQLQNALNSQTPAAAASEPVKSAVEGLKGLFK